MCNQDIQETTQPLKSDRLKSDRLKPDRLKPDRLKTKLPATPGCSVCRDSAHGLP